jgi:hypothetical protein
MYYIPAAILFVCAALYIFENKAKSKKWLYGAAAFALHIFAVIYFFSNELGMETLLLFLLASFALTLGAGALKK